MSRLSATQVKDLVKASEDNPKFTRTPDGQSLYLLTRNGRGYWSYQWREGAASRAKMLGTAADMSPAAARIKREEEAVKRRSGKTSERRGAANRKRSRKRKAGAVKLFSEVVAEYLVGVAPNWTGGLEGLEAKAYRRTLTMWRRRMSKSIWETSNRQLQKRPDSAFKRFWIMRCSKSIAPRARTLRASKAIWSTARSAKSLQKPNIILQCVAPMSPRSWLS
jgi:hypothetical protein